MSKSERATKIIFWLAFGAFLSMSIPHVAWVFRYYEPKSDGYDFAWWLLSLGVAIGIDVLICWLSYMRIEDGTKRGVGDGIITWTFIALLALLSWYFNWLFSESMVGVNVWSIDLGYGWTVGNLTPFIVSAIPVFLIAYTYMSRHILGKKQPAKSALELQKIADELEAQIKQKQRIHALKNQQQSSYISGKIQMFKSVISSENVPAIPEQATDTLELDVPEVLPEIESKTETKVPIHLGMIEQRMYEAFMQHPQEAQQLIRLSQEQSLAQLVETLQAKYSQYASYITPERVSHVMQYIGEQNKEEIPAPEEKHIDLISDKYFMTWEQAVVYTGYAESTLKKQLKAGEIETNKKGDKLKVSTLKIKPGITAHMPVLSTDKVPATNGHYWRT